MRDKLLNYSVLHPNPTNKLVKIHSAPFWCSDKPWATLNSLDSPWPGLGGSHHLPPYSILCSSPPHLHPYGSFSWDSQSGVLKLSWFGLPTFLSTITCAANVQMAHARPFWTYTLQDLFNGIKNTSMRGVLAPVIALLVSGSPGGLPSPIFGNVSGDLTLPSKWGCNITNH